MTYAVKNYIALKMGDRYGNAARVPMQQSFLEAGPATPVFFILSPGVDPVKEVELLGKGYGVS